MTTPIATLLIFALWTLMILICGTGYYRVSRVLRRKASPASFKCGEISDTDSDFYARGMRAHLNCVENLPIYASIILAISYLKLSSPLINTLCIIFITARILHSLIHLTYPQRTKIVTIRFYFYLAQVIIMLWLTLVALSAAF